MKRRAILGLVALCAALPGAGAAWAGEEPKKKKSGGADYLPFATLTGTTRRANGRRGVLTVDCGLEVADLKLRAFADASIPRLRAAYVQAVLTYAAGLPPGAPPNAELIAQSLQRQTDLVLGRPGARLLVGAIMVN